MNCWFLAFDETSDYGDRMPQDSIDLAQCSATDHSEGRLDVEQGRIAAGVYRNVAERAADGGYKRKLMLEINFRWTDGSGPRSA
jgi:hypothetical protein